MRLLFGASFILGNIYGGEISKNTFLFCLHKADNPLQISVIESDYKIDNQKLNEVLHSIGIVNLEPWIPGASDKDRDGDIYLNRI